VIRSTGRISVCGGSAYSWNSVNSSTTSPFRVAHCEPVLAEALLPLLQVEDLEAGVHDALLQLARTSSLSTL